MTERTLSRLPAIDLWMKGGALGMAGVVCFFLNDFVNKQYTDNQKFQDTLVSIVREQNAGLLTTANAQHDMTRAIENNNRLIETLLLERRTGGIRTASATPVE